MEHDGVPADLPLWTLAAVPELRLGARDGPGTDVFGSIRDTEVRRDGVIVVADAMASEIRAFDAAGAHLWSTGRGGEGPGEFPRPPPPAWTACPVTRCWSRTGAARDTLGPFPLSEIVEHDGRTVTLTYNSGSGVTEGYRQKRWG